MPIEPPQAGGDPCELWRIVKQLCEKVNALENMRLVDVKFSRTGKLIVNESDSVITYI